MPITDADVERYCVEKSRTPEGVLKELELHTRQHISHSNMLVGPLEASFLGQLVRLGRAKRILEIGTYTGYSALAMAQHLPSDGELITLDVNEDTVALGKKFWARDPHGTKIRSIIGPALETIPRLEGLFDVVFIDADKENYCRYVQMTLPKLSARGLIILDNCLWAGDVLKTTGQDKATLGIQEVNNYLSQNSELYVTLCPIRDGVFLVQKNSLVF
jgi:caffeoyl-CoA O-methyltransferase